MARCFGKALERSHRGFHAPTLQPRDYATRGLHARRQLLLRKIGASARANEKAGEPKFFLEVCIRLGIARSLLQPFPVQILDAGHFTSLARCNAIPISEGGVFCVFLTNARTMTTRCPLPVT